MKKRLIIIMLLFGLLLTGCSFKKEVNNSNNSNNEVQDKNLYVKEKDSYKIAKAKIMYKYGGADEEFEFPINLNDLINYGFTNDNINTKFELGKISGSDKLYLPNSEVYVNIKLINKMDEDTMYRNGYIYSIESSTKYISINDIIPTFTIYDDVIKTFGKDKKDREELFINERNKGKVTLEYISDSSYEDGAQIVVNNKKYNVLKLSISFDEYGIVESVKISFE